MDTHKICRCCLAEGIHKDLNAPHTWFNQKEVYSAMLQECFDVVLSPTGVERSGICEACVGILRDSLVFKKRVLQSEEEFLRKLQGLCEGEDKPVTVKLEMKRGSDDDSDDYFLADAVRSYRPEDVEIKEECLPARHKRRTKIKSIADRLKKSGTRISTSRKSHRSIINSTASNKRKIDVNTVWKSPATDKEKHKSNLQTILNYSNAMPFKNKSMLGYICGYCNESYPDPKDLRAHTELSHQKDRVDYKTSFDLTDYSVKLDVTDLKCTLCDAELNNLFLLKDHLVKIHSKTIHSDIKDHLLQFKIRKGEVYDCVLCSSTYETFKMLKQHMNTHYSNYKCGKCESAFATRRSLNAHKTTHIEGSFKCDYCDKVFSNRSKKQYHEKMKHFGARNISNCQFCNQPFKSYYQRNQHMIKEHDSEAQYKCNICDKAYILKSLLMYHIKKNHLMEKNCQCTECGFRFFSKKALKAHMIKHTGERIYACGVCNKSYARKYTLKEHMRIHNNDRRFKCTQCELTFVQKCSLKSHLLSNHGISMAASDITERV